MLQNIWLRLAYFLQDFWLYLVLCPLALALFIFGAYKIYKSNYSEREKKIFLAVTFTIFLSVLIFTAFEGYFRYVYDQSDGLGYLKTNAKWLQRHVTFNNDFVRDRNFTQNKEEGTIRIGAFGDSLTFGAGIKDPSNRYSNILEKMLKSSGQKVEVYNFGRSGMDTEGEIEYYNKVKPFNFDIVVWQYYPNDIQPANASTGTPIINNVTAPPIVKALSNISHFFDFLYWRFSSKYQTTFTQLKNADLAQYQNPEVLEQHISQIKNFVSSLKQENKKFIVIIFPFAHLVGSNYSARDVHLKMGQVFKDAGADAVIDLLPDLENKKPKEITASRFDSHPNETVHKLAAEKLFEEVTKQLIHK